MEISVRQASLADAAMIADISRQTFYDSFAAQNTEENMQKFMNEQFTREALIKEVGQEGNIFLIAETGGKTAGYARLRDGEYRPEFNDEPSMELARIYALKDAIGKGIGNALLQECVRLAIENKRKVLWLGVWEHNPRAIRFYEKNGFRKFAEHDFILGTDVQTDWLMKKKL